MQYTIKEMFNDTGFLSNVFILNSNKRWQLGSVKAT